MKKAFILLSISLLSMVVFSQNIGIIPMPQKVEQKEGVFTWTDNICVTIDKKAPYRTVFFNQVMNLIENNSVKAPVKIIFKTVAELGITENADQAYVMEITPKVITIQATSESGWFNATQTLRQLYRYHKLSQSTTQLEIPCMTIVDWPNLKYRGWLDDISRGPIPNMDFIKKEIEILSEYKMNFFNLYTEHVFKVNSHPDVAPTDGLSAAEVRELTSFAKQYNIEFIGNQQCFAHAEDLMSIPFYDNIKDGWANLNPDAPETYDYLRDVFAEVATAYESPLFNINCDETEGLGTGKARNYVKRVGADTAYCAHIDSVYSILQQYGKKVMMWGDIVAKSPEMINMLPEDMQFIVWSYVSADDFTEIIEPIRQSGHEFWVAPGMSMWSVSFPDIDTYIKNIANLVRDGYKAGAQGMMNTAWDDSGESLFNSAWHGMSWAADMGWNTIKSSGTESDTERIKREQIFNRNFDIQFFCSPKYSFTELLYATNNLRKDPNIGECMNFGTLNQTLLNFYPSRIDSTAEAHFSNNATALKVIHDIARSKKNLKELSIQPDATAVKILDNAQVAAQRIYVTSQLGLLRIMFYKNLENPSPENMEQCKAKAAQTMKLLYNLKCNYIYTWDLECRPYSREVVTKRYDKIAQEILDADKHIFISPDLSADGVPVITLRTLYNDRPIYYTTDGAKPTQFSQLYTKPFSIDHSCLVKAVCFDEWNNSFINEKYMVYHKGMGHLKAINSEYSKYNATYSGGGDNALLDGVIGSETTYADGHWQGYQGQDIDVEIDFGKKTQVNEIKMNFLQNTFDWILSPETIEIYISKDGKKYTLVRTEQLHPDFRQSGNVLNNAGVNNLNLKTRFLRVVAKNPGPLPKWHPSKDYPSYIFADEILVY